MIERAGTVAKLSFKAHPHMLRHACGYALANRGHEREPSRRTLDIGTSSIRCVIRSCRRCGSRISGVSEMFSLAELESTIPLVRESVLPTPQYAWPLLRERIGVEVVVKHENHTPIGSFKVRGGVVFFDRLKRQRPQVEGIVTATRGNHGQSLAFAGAAPALP